jgi:bifunctional non-homologous end joining protein LigD
VSASADLLEKLSADSRRLLRPEPEPQWIAPMLATLTHHHFSSGDWLFERKLDGERCLAFRSGSGVRLLSRNKRYLDSTYPEIVDALARGRGHDVVLDGEVVAFERGQTSFARLQRRMGITDASAARHSGVAISYYVFDLLHLDGYDVRQLPLRERKVLLRDASSFDAPLYFTAHRDRYGEAYLREACEHGWEGLIAKRADAPYVSMRSTDWLKFRCSNEQELVIVGFSDPRGTRVGLGALLLGYYEEGRLIYAGKVGTGFNTVTLRSLRRQLGKLEQANRPITTRGRVRERGVHWVAPRLVAQVAFTEWTTDGLLRHPRYLGLRHDKVARDVVRERPREVAV